jgi:hypothetical protein
MATDLVHDPARPPRIPAVARILSQFDRPHLEGFITVAISLLDVLDGDADLEPSGDELDGTNAEDEIGNNHLNHTDPGAGCKISDPDSAVDDRPCDEPMQDLEPDYDAERETWSHWMDHPPGLHIGCRPDWSTGEAKPQNSPAPRYGIDQTRPTGPKNPEAL